MASVSLAATSAIDPTDTAVGSRQLGFGGITSVGNSQIYSLYANPAGLQKSDELQLTSTYTKKISEIDFVILGVTTQFGDDAFGLGYVRSDSGKGYTGRIIGNTLEVIGSTSIQNNALQVSYAREFFKNIRIGTSVKFISADYTSTGVSSIDASASGMDIDLGLLWDPMPQLSVGLLQKNLLPIDAGGKLTWSTGTVEGYNTSTLIGVGYEPRPGLTLLGQLDFDVDRPVQTLFDLGLEWQIHPTTALRIGYDETEAAVSDTAFDRQGDITLGMGLKVGGLVFDMAYHPYGTLSTNATWYFTLSWLGGPLKTAEKIVVREPVLKKPLVKFFDVPAGYWAQNAIEHLATAGIISGYPDETFRPEEKITRAEISTLLMKTKARLTELDKPLQFTDVAKSHWAAPYISKALDEGIVKGYPDYTFRPSGSISRAEGVTMVARFDKLPAPINEAASFRDLPGRHWAFPYVEAAYEAKMLDYLKGAVFLPDKLLTRAEAAYLIAKTKVGKAAIADLYEIPK